MPKPRSPSWNLKPRPPARRRNPTPNSSAVSFVFSISSNPPRSSEPTSSRSGGRGDSRASRTSSAWSSRSPGGCSIMSSETKLRSSASYSRSATINTVSYLTTRKNESASLCTRKCAALLQPRLSKPLLVRPHAFGGVPEYPLDGVHDRRRLLRIQCLQYVNQDLRGLCAIFRLHLVNRPEIRQDPSCCIFIDAR